MEAPAPERQLHLGVVDRPALRGRDLQHEDVEGVPGAGRIPARRAALRYTLLWTRDEKRRPRAAHSRASAGTRLWSWLKITVAPSSKCLATSDGLDPGGVGHVLAGTATHEIDRAPAPGR